MDEFGYYSEYMSEIYARAGAAEDFAEEQFVEEMSDFLVDQAILPNFSISFFRKTQQGIRVDAWDFEPDKKELCLLVADFSASKSIGSLTQTEVDAIFARVEKFFEKSKAGLLVKEMDEAFPVYSLSRLIADNSTAILRVRFILLSNRLLSSRVGSIERDKLSVESSYEIWDIGRRFRIAESGKAREDIVIDFTNQTSAGLRYLDASSLAEGVQSYLLVLSGELLAELYEKYGERLLEQNVRTFLQFRGGVNKAIRNTILTKPEMFFAYNNGLSVTADEVEILNGHIVRVRNLQIVNGGQTTASLFMARYIEKERANLRQINVQVKLTVVRPEMVDELVPIISRSANTQNKVNDADFFSNHAFHKRIEEFSRRVLAPSKSGSLKETYWYYERTRGQYANQQSRMQKKERDKFQQQFPKSQVITKTDLAKYEASFLGQPHFVSRGAQWNFAKFAEYIGGSEGKPGVWEKDESIFNEPYFKSMIARATIFRELDALVSQQEWYSGYKANIVTYSIAKLCDLVAVRSLHLNFGDIWSKQSMPNVLSSALIEIARLVSLAITDTSENVTQFCKKPAALESVKAINYPLPAELSAWLLDKESVWQDDRAARKIQRIDSGIYAQIEVVKRGQKYWSRFMIWAQDNSGFSDKDLSILRSTLKLTTAPPSELQCRRVLELELLAKTKGFFSD